MRQPLGQQHDALQRVRCNRHLQDAQSTLYNLANFARGHPGHWYLDQRSFNGFMLLYQLSDRVGHTHQEESCLNRMVGEHLHRIRERGGYARSEAVKLINDDDEDIPRSKLNEDTPNHIGSNDTWQLVRHSDLEHRGLGAEPDGPFL